MRMAWLLAIALAPGCASIGPLHDPLCAEIVRFANAVEPGTVARVTLCADWGPRCASGGAYFVYSKRCEHGGYEPASRLCAYLLDHSSAEFPDNNFAGALACLGKGVHEPGRYGDYAWTSAA